MAAAISFRAGSGDVTAHVFADVTVTSSGLGFYGTSFGQSVQVDYWQDSTYITDSGGSSQGPKANNAKYNGTTASTAGINGSAQADINTLPNSSGTVNLRFTFDSPVKTQNAKLYVYDRTTKTSHASGVYTAVAQLVHPWADNRVSASSTNWNVMSGVGNNYITMVDSPGSGGNTPGGDVADVRHDWFALLSAQPKSIGSKTQFGMFFELEYV